MKSKSLVYFLSGLFFLTFFSITSYSQTQDVDAYKTASGLKDNNKKIEAFKKFVSDFPSSRYTPYAKFEIFSAYLEINQTDSALVFANLFIESFPPSIRINAYNDVAFALAQKKVGLDSAAVYAQKAVTIARTGNVRNLGMYLDTQALVLYDMGKPDSALTLGREAIVGHENDPAFLSNLANYEYGSGLKDDALKAAARAILFGNTDDALSNFDKWISETKATEKDRQQLREEVVNFILKSFLEESKADDKFKVNSTAAAFLANTGANLEQANTWAKESIASLKDNLSVEDKVLYTKNYALVLAAENKFDEAIKEFNSVENLVDPWDSDFWYSLAKTYEKIGDKKKALDAYISGSVAFPAPKITKALKELAEKEGLSDSDIQSKIETRQKELAEFNPGHFEKKTNGNIVLAELFTGAECGPCAGADGAFDALSEYFPRNTLAILEYHVHIPAPDPMTNPDTFDRYKFYGGNFGTPTVIIGGIDRITGGGPKFLAENRFNVYKYSIEKYLDKKPAAIISGSAKQLNDEVKVNFKIQKENLSEKNISLHIALAEKSIHYEGSNGVTKHIFVVRNLIKGANGLPLELKKGNENISESFNVNEIEKQISTYLDDPSKDPSWRRGLPFSGWKQRTDKIDRNNLAIVVWLQNNESKEILQSFYLDVPANISASKHN